MRRRSSFLYRAARLSRDVEATERSIEAGDPSYAQRRVRNVLIGKAHGNAGFWQALWGDRR